jgi:hypothetical protein
MKDGLVGQWAGVYGRGSVPEAGSVLTFRANGRMRMGHVAVGSRVITLRQHSCYVPTRHCLRSVSSCATVALGRRRSTPRSTATLCEQSPAPGRDASHERPPPSPHRLLGRTSRPRLQACSSEAGARQYRQPLMAADASSAGAWCCSQARPLAESVPLQILQPASRHDLEARYLPLGSPTIDQL